MPSVDPSNVDPSADTTEADTTPPASNRDDPRWLVAREAPAKSLLRKVLAVVLPILSEWVMKRVDVFKAMRALAADAVERPLFDLLPEDCQDVILEVDALVPWRCVLRLRRHALLLIGAIDDPGSYHIAYSVGHLRDALARRVRLAWPSTIPQAAPRWAESRTEAEQHEVNQLRALLDQDLRGEPDDRESTTK